MMAKGAVQTVNATNSWLFGKINKIDHLFSKIEIIQNNTIKNYQVVIRNDDEVCRTV